MADLINCRNIAKAYSTDALFEDLNLAVREGERMGLIGPNGAGKSTLLRIMGDLEPPDEGEVVVRKGLRRVYIPQAVEYDEDADVFAIATAKARDARVREDELEAAVNVSLGRAGFTEPGTRVATLSGGWRKRLTLACGLAAQGDVLLLDEPTNHLDLEGVLWLEQLLATAPFAWVLVSHDRYFLNRTAARIAELNPIFPEGMLTVDGDYGHFQEQRAAFLESQARQKEALANKVRRETEWLQKSPKARTTKARFRIKAAWRLIETLDEMKAAQSEQSTGIDFVASGRQTRKLVQLRAVTKQRGDRKIAEKLDLMLSPGTRLGLLGGNGSGKTTLLKMIANELSPDRGEVIHAPDLKVVCFDQRRAQLDPDQTLARALSETGDTVIYRDRTIHLVGWARRFRFTADQLPLPVGELSGGEQARLLIAKLMLQDADVLLLDEPTNDLDIDTLETLEDSLARFAGALVLVTHDRFMISRLCDSFIALDGSGGHLAVASYEQWEGSLGGEEKKTPKKAKSKPRRRNEPAKLSYNDRREFDGMEARILEAEDRLAACQAESEDPDIASDAPRLLAAHEALTAAEKEVEALYERWAALGEMAGE